MDIRYRYNIMRESNISHDQAEAMITKMCIERNIGVNRLGDVLDEECAAFDAETVRQFRQFKMTQPYFTRSWEFELSGVQMERVCVLVSHAVTGEWSCRARRYYDDDVETEVTKSHIYEAVNAAIQALFPGWDEIGPGWSVAERIGRDLQWVGIPVVERVNDRCQVTVHSFWGIPPIPTMRHSAHRPIDELPSEWVGRQSVT
jgi:hypothetical protein